MRIQYWPALVCSWMLAATSVQSVLADGPADRHYGAVAQADAVDDFDPDDATDQAGNGEWVNPYQPVQYAGNPYAGAGSGYAPGGEGYYGQGMPPANAWPETSPFNQHRLQETYNDTGLWNYNTADDFAGTYIFSAEYLYGHGQKPGFHQIGDPNFASTVFIPGDSQSAFAAFPSQSTGIFNHVFHEGVRLRYGYFHPDGSGMMLSGFLLAENNVNTGRYTTYGSPASPLNLASIIVDNNGTGLALPFDARFYQRYSQEILGADADFFLAPFFTRDSFKLKMLYGVKYLRINETFFVQGDDTGEGYTVTSTVSSSGGGGGGTGGTGGTGTNVIAITGPITHIGPPYTTIINSTTTNNLVGPILGLRYELGGNKLKFWGMTKFGVMADIENIGVSSANVNQFKTATAFTSPPPNVFTSSPSLSPALVPTHVTNTNTHIVPLVDTSINVDVPIFSIIPVVNRMSFFKTANFRVGYQYVWVGEIARAPEIIQYNLHTPTIKSGARTSFGYDVVNFAVDWKW